MSLLEYICLYNLMLLVAFFAHVGDDDFLTLFESRLYFHEIMQLGISWLDGEEVIVYVRPLDQ